MKHTIFIYMLNSILTVFTAASLTAQFNAVITTPGATQAPASVIQQNDAMPENTAGRYRNVINTKVVRKFITAFKDAEYVSWDKLNDGSSIARFTKDSVKTTIMYNKKGMWNYTLKRYAENKMPADIREVVRSTWYDYSIVEVTELMLQSERGDVIFNILIQFSGNYKTIQIRNKQMEIINDYTKP